MKSTFTRALKRLYFALPFLLIAAVFLAYFLYPKPQREEEKQKVVVRVWNVDTFAGGRGSRTNFLKSVAREVEENNAGVYYLISSYTQEGALAALKEGEAPDILSFGIGLSAFLERAQPLPYVFAGGQTEQGCFAYPWCKGAYYLFSLTDDFTQTGSVALSAGAGNLVEVAAALAGIRGEGVDALSAYSAFLSGKYRYLLGTQRDVCRFSSREIAVYRKELSEFCDLYQYVSLLTTSKQAQCMQFLDALLSDATQEKLSQIGMYPARSGGAERTVSVFLDQAALDNVRKSVQTDEGIKNLNNFLKNI